MRESKCFSFMMLRMTRKTKFNKMYILEGTLYALIYILYQRSVMKSKLSVLIRFGLFHHPVARATHLYYISQKTKKKTKKNLRFRRARGQTSMSRRMNYFL
jgi:acyl dehydratase